MRRDSLKTAQHLYEIASGQGGYFTSSQALQVGYTYPQQHHHTTRGNWMKIDRGIYRLQHYPPTDREDLIRLTLWSHNRKGEPQAVVSHETALSVHQMSDIMPDKIHLTVPLRRFRKEPPSGVILHRANFDQDEIEVHHGYLVTKPLRTLVDAASSSLSQEHLDAAIREAIDKGLVRRGRLIQEKYSSEIQRRIEQSLTAYDLNNV